MMFGRLVRQRRSQSRRDLLALALGSVGAIASIAACSEHQERKDRPASSEDSADDKGPRRDPGADAVEELWLQRDARHRLVLLLGKVTPLKDDTCFIDANGDGVRDIALWSGESDNAHVVMVDAKTGRGIWAAPRLPELATGILHCADSSTVVVGESDFTVRAYEATTGLPRWTAKVSNVPVRFASGDACVSVLGRDGKEVGLSIKTGAELPCSASAEAANAVRPTTEQAVTFVTAGLAFTASGERGALALTAKKDGAQLWQRDLGIFAAFRQDPFRSRLAYTDRVIAVAGRLGPSDEVPLAEVVLVGVDVLTGNEIWRRKFLRESRVPRPARLEFVIAEGGRIYTATDRLSEIDPSTGKDLWVASLPDGASNER